MVTYKSIAALTGVSIGTVYRVLRNRGRVAPATAERVREVATRLDYTPNVHASNLKRSRTHVIGVIIPHAADDNEYWAAPIAGITDAARDMSRYRIDVRIVTYTARSTRSFEERWHQTIGAEPDGLVVACPPLADPGRLLAELPERMPRVYIDTDIADERRLAFIGHDSRQSGRVAGRVLDLLAGRRGRVIIVRTMRHSDPIDRRVLGVTEYLRSNRRIVFETVDVDLAGSRDDRAGLARAITRGTRPAALFVTNSAGSVVLDALATMGITGIPMIGYDLVPGNVAALRAGKIDFLLNQRPYDQGRRAIMALHRAIVLGEPTHGDELMPVDIVTAENVDGYL